MSDPRKLPPLPPGFELVPQEAPQSATSGLPPIPEGFELVAPQQAPAPSSSRVSAPSSRVQSGGDAAVLGMVDGATFGFLDEAASGLDYLLDKLPGRQGRSYDDILAANRGEMTGAQEAHPYAYTGGQVVGAVGSGLVGAAAAPATASRALGLGAQTVRGQLGAATLSGAGLGAVDGFGRGEGGVGNRLLSARNSAAIGGGFGFASVPAGKLIGAGVNAVADRFATSGAPIGRSSMDLLQRTLGDEGLTFDQAAQRARDLGPSAMLADTSEGLRYRAEQIAQSDTPARANVINALKERSGGARDRIGSAYDGALGQRPDVQQTLDDLLSSRSAAAKPLYDRALERPVQFDERLGDFLKDPIVKGGLNRGVEIQRLEALADNVPFHPNDIAVTGFDDAGEAILGEVPNFKTLNVVKKGLDALVDDNRNEFGKLTQRGVAIDKVRAAFLGKLDEINPDYAAARASWAGPTQAMNAFENGRQLFGSKLHPDTLRRDFGRLSEGERDAFRLGTRAAVDEAMGRVRNGALKGRQLLDSDFNERKILTVLGEEDGRGLINALQGEQAMADTANQAISNSATARRQDNPFTASAPNLGNMAQSLFHAGRYALQQGVDAVSAGSRGRMAQELAPVLTSTGDAREEAVRRVAAAMNRRGASQDLDPKRRALVEALTRGGALSLAPRAPR